MLDLHEGSRVPRASKGREAARYRVKLHERSRVAKSLQEPRRWQVPGQASRTFESRQEPAKSAKRPGTGARVFQTGFPETLSDRVQLEGCLNLAWLPRPSKGAKRPGTGPMSTKGQGLPRAFKGCEAARYRAKVYERSKTTKGLQGPPRARSGMYRANVYEKSIATNNLQGPRSGQVPGQCLRKVKVH
uniref:Uncharacterized protein n=1 Tax=Ditylenchus dipsaci TaxID=166011 RepID=A0A915DRM9_9BILA